MIRIRHTTNPFDAKAYKTIEIEGTGILLYEITKRPEFTDKTVFMRGSTVLKSTSILNEGDDIVAFEYVAEGAFWAAVWNIGVFLFYAAAVISLVYSFYSFFTMSKPSTGSGSQGLEGSQTYSWDGIQTVSDVGIAVPIVYGEHRVGGNIINAYISTDGTNNYLNLLLALCEGEIESISDVYINDQPSANFDDIILYTDRLGTNTDTTIPHFEDLNDNYTVGQSLNNLNDVYTYTTQGSLVEAFEVQLSFPNGIFQQNASNGNIESWAVGVKVECSVHGEDDWTTVFDGSVSGASQTEVKKYIRKEGLTAEQYDIKITRTTEASSSYKFGFMTLQYVVEVRTDDLIYPNTAKLGVRALATSQLSGTTPNVTCVVKGKKVELPKVMYSGSEVAWEDYYWDSVAEEYKRFSDDASCTWDGSTWVTRYSANPVWCIRDLLTNTRYGLGDHISTAQVDKDSLLAVSRYCDERVSDGAGGYEKRMRMDIVLDSTSRALDVMLQLVSAFRAVIFYSGTGFKMAIDKEASPVQLFGAGNIIAGSLSQTFKAGKERPNVIEVQYLDKDENYKQQVVSVIDEEAIADDEPIRKESIRLFVTRKSQALRDARYLLLFKKYCTRSVTFRAGIDAIACQPGDVISVSNDFTQWGFSGRVGSGGSTTSVPIDRTMTIESGKTYEIMVRFADDTIETKLVTNAPGDHTAITVSSAFSQAPSAFDVYSVGEQNSVKKDFRIVNMKRTGDLDVEITAIEYNALIFDTDTITIPTYNASALSLDIPAVESLKLTERLVRLGDGTIENCIDVWWRRPDPNSRYVLYKKAKVYISDDDGDSWDLLGETENGHFQILGNLIDGTEYTVKVTTVTFDNRETAFATSPSQTITLVGKSAPPSDVSTFLCNQSRDRLYFGWSEVTDIDLFGYEIRFGETWESGEVIATQLKNTNFILLSFPEGVQSYWIKAIDTSGNYSTTAKEAVITIENIPFQNIIEEYQEQTSWTGTKTDLSIVGDNLEIDTGELSGTYETPVRDVGFVANFKIGVSTVVVDATGSDAEWDDDPDATFADSETRRFSGDEVVGAVSLQIKTSEDNTTWTDYQTYQPGDYKCRYFQLKATVSRETTDKVIQLVELNSYADLPDVQERQDATITVAADGVDIVFDKTFHQDPYVNVTILSGSGVYHAVTSLDTTGCNIKLYNSAGTAQTGTIRVLINGV